MIDYGNSTGSDPSDREIALTRGLRCPPADGLRRVLEARTAQALVRSAEDGRWWCVKSTFEWAAAFASMRGPDGRDMGMRGVYREIAPPERSVHRVDERGARGRG